MPWSDLLAVRNGPTPAQALLAATAGSAKSLAAYRHRPPRARKPGRSPRCSMRRHICTWPIAQECRSLGSWMTNRACRPRRSTSPRSGSPAAARSIRNSIMRGWMTSDVARYLERGSSSMGMVWRPLRTWSANTKRSGSGRGSRMLAMRSSNRGPSLFAYSKTRNGTPPAVVPEIASSTLRTKPSPNGGAWCREPTPMRVGTRRSSLVPAVRRVTLPSDDQRKAMRGRGSARRS